MKIRILISALFFFLVSLASSFAAPEKPHAIKLFPNPVINNEITISTSTNFYKIEILSMLGQVLQFVEMEPSKTSRLDLELKPGVYLVRVTFNDQSSDTKRIWVN